MRTIDGNPGSIVCKKRMTFSFIAGYRTPIIWPNGLALRVGVCWSWTISWKKGDRTNACWICSPKTPIIATLPCCIWPKIYFHLANSPRRLIAMPIILWPSKTHGIKRAYGPFYCKPFPTVGVKVLRLFKLVTSRPFGYLMFDVYPASDDRYRLWSCMLDSMLMRHVTQKQ